MVKKVAIIGPESTGKSTLSEHLAQHYNTLWVPEYAREYLTENGMNYTYDSLLTIAKGQIELEEKALSQATKPLVFIDTDMNVMKVWAEFVFGKCHQFILDQIAARKYDLYLLCNIDLPWAPDPLREYPDPGPRQQLFRIYQDILINQSTPWSIISGDAEQRLQTAVNKIALTFALE